MGVTSDTLGSNISSLTMSWIQGGVFLLFVLIGTVAGMDPGSAQLLSSVTEQLSILGSQLSTLGSQLIQLQKQVEVLQQEHMEDKERMERRVSLLESVCGSTQMETEIPGEQEETISTNGSSTSTDLRYLMAIGGYNGTNQHSAEVLNTSCDFPLPEARSAHISVNTADGKTLVCGGYTPSGPTASCLQFNPESKTWDHHSNMKSNRYLASIIVLS